MSLSKELKSKIIDYIKQPIPQNVNMAIVKQSIPVPFFGNIETSKVATISINPSNKEFEDDNKNLLRGSDKRFVDRDVLKVNDTDYLSKENADAVYDSLINYFDHNPYMRWFGPLEKYVGNMFDCFYSKGTMVHLDIYPWATQNKWDDKIYKDTDKQRALKDYNLLKDILLAKEFKYIYINGNMVKKQIENYFGITFSEIRSGVQISKNKKAERIIYQAKLAGGTVLIGSSCYIQNSYGTDLKNLHDALSQYI